MRSRRFLSRSAAVRGVVVLIVVCAMPASTSLSTATMSLSQGTASTCRARLGIATTSDWTTVRLLSGGSLQELTVISASAQVLSAGVDDDTLSLSQPLSRAEAGHRVELVVEALITGLEPEGTLVFEIERGHIGSTQVDVSSYQDEAPRVIAVLTWDGMTPSERNAQTFDVSSEALIGTGFNEYTVIAQLNFWYFGPGQGGGFGDGKGNRQTPLTPLLGDYWSNDPSVVYQQIEWAAEYGVDAFSIEWTIPRGMPSCCASMEDTLDDVFLKSSNIHKIRWAIFYDFILRIDQTPGLDVDLGRIDFDRPEVYDIFVADFVHFAKKYFGHPQYLTVGGRPVIYIWATNSYIGDLAGAIQEARGRVSELGFDVFIVGDEVCIDCFDADHAALFDGSSTFTFLIPGLDVSTWSDVGDAAAAVDSAFQWWRDQLAGLRVTGREELVNFQPAWAPQYDERYVRFDRPTYVPARSRDQVVEMAMVARRHAQPVGTCGQKLVWLNTWNCWGETTTVEPTADLGPKYPAGNYQFDMLEVVREVFGRETFYTSPLPCWGISSDTKSGSESATQNARHGNDRDGDSVPDDEDYCPDWPGNPETDGC